MVLAQPHEGHSTFKVSEGEGKGMIRVRGSGRERGGRGKGRREGGRGKEGGRTGRRESGSRVRGGKEGGRGGAGVREGGELPGRPLAPPYLRRLPPALSRAVPPSADPFSFFPLLFFPFFFLSLRIFGQLFTYVFSFL